MKMVNDFKEFLEKTVNINDDRLSKLNKRAETIESFIRSSDWGPKIVSFLEQGSWAHETIIKPVDQGEFDADLLAKVKAVDGWTAKQYVEELGRVFKDSAVYGDKVQVCDYCVTITYADDCKIDVAPLVVDRRHQGDLEVCNRKTDAFQESQPAAFTSWMREKNNYSGSNSFRKTTRLIKYIRDIKLRFTCPSVLLTTLIGYQIQWNDKGTPDFADTPTSLQTIFGRLDDWLQANPEKPKVPNPSMPHKEDFADLWTDTQYKNFRKFIHKYRAWIDEAVASTSRGDSISKWRRIFGDDFAKGEEGEQVEASTRQKAVALLRSGGGLISIL